MEGLCRYLLVLVDRHPFELERPADRHDCSLCVMIVVCMQGLLACGSRELGWCSKSYFLKKLRRATVTPLALFLRSTILSSRPVLIMIVISFYQIS